MKFVVSIDRDEDGIWIVECPSIPGCVSQGKTKEEMLVNIEAAIHDCLEVVRKRSATNHRNTASGSGGLMPRLPVLSGSEGEGVFQALGWQVARQKGSHIILQRQGIWLLSL